MNACMKTATKLSSRITGFIRRVKRASFICALASIGLILSAGVGAAVGSPEQADSSELTWKEGDLQSIDFRRPGYNIMFIDFDGLRADRLSCYGYHRKTSPFIDKLAERGLLFRNAIAQSTWTEASSASVYTSLYPSVHGILDFHKRPEYEHNTLQSVLKKSRYKVRTFDPFQKEETFKTDIFKVFFSGFNSELDRLSRARFSIFIQNFDMHLPYRTELVFNSGCRNRLLKILKSMRESIAVDPGLLRTSEFNEEDIQCMKDQYDASIVYIDRHLEKIFNGLEERKLLDKTIIFIYSNHGEQHNEHGHWFHGVSYFEEDVRVPLLILHPAVNQGNSRAFDQVVELIDIFPTALEMLGLEIPRDIQGQSLVPLIQGRAGESDFTRAFSEANHIDHTYRNMVRTNRWKLIQLATPLTKSGEQSPQPAGLLLFDLQADPHELEDLSKKRPDMLRELSIVLKEWETRNQLKYKMIRDSPSKEKKEFLKKYGYWGR